MTKAISLCPACRGKLHISTLTCPDCGMELKNTFELSRFDTLDTEKTAFLLSFLRNRGNLKNVQEELEMSYPTAKRKLDEILSALDLADENTKNNIEGARIDISNWYTDRTSNKASEIIKTKLKESGGKATVYTIRGLPCEIWVDSDGVSMVSDKLPIKPAYRFDVFDTIVELLVANHCHAKKGNGRNYRLGGENCDDTTVVGYIARHYSHKKDGDSVFDPVFVLSAVLEWAGIARNEYGELVLTAEYRAKL